MAKSYTGRGDDGTTANRGKGRMSKSDPLPHALGALDETNSTLGVIRSLNEDADLTQRCEELQHLLFRVGADLATPPEKEPMAPRVTREDTTLIEQKTDALDDELPELKAFILPGGMQSAAYFHLARAFARRCERETIAAKEAGYDINEDLLPFLNRLSSYLFALARYTNHKAGRSETNPKYTS